jgi:hypothetical protein
MYEPTWINEPLETSIPIELPFTAPARRAQDLSQEQPGLLHNLLEGLNGSTTPSYLGGGNLQE